MGVVRCDFNSASRTRHGTAMRGHHEGYAVFTTVSHEGYVRRFVSHNKKNRYGGHQGKKGGPPGGRSRACAAREWRSGRWGGGGGGGVLRRGSRAVAARGGLWS